MKPNDLHSLSVSVARLGRGLTASHPAPRQPEKPLELFDFEGCPYCRKVREALSELDLDYVARTSARGSSARIEGAARGGKQQFPLLDDPNTRALLYESEAIIDYLHATYGAGRPRWQTLTSRLDTAGSILASALRPRGRRVREGLAGRAQPPALLELWNFEASPYCRKVREELAELGLDYRVHNVAKKSLRRPQLVALGGKMQVPYLVDPNTGVAMYESNDIVAYLRATYGPGAGLA